MTVWAPPPLSSPDLFRRPTVMRVQTFAEEVEMNQHLSSFCSLSVMSGQLAAMQNQLNEMRAVDRDEHERL